jgi:hypothetical protein
MLGLAFCCHVDPIVHDRCDASMGMMCIVDARWHVSYWAHVLGIAGQRELCLLCSDSGLTNSRGWFMVAGKSRH